MRAGEERIFSGVQGNIAGSATRQMRLPPGFSAARDRRNVLTFLPVLRSTSLRDLASRHSFGKRRRNQKRDVRREKGRGNRGGPFERSTAVVSKRRSRTTLQALCPLKGLAG